MPRSMDDFLNESFTPSTPKESNQPVRSMDDFLTEAFSPAPSNRAEQTTYVGSKLTPEQSSQILDIQKKTGLPPAFIERNLEPIKQKLVQADIREFAKLNPSTGAWLAESPYNTALALDDFENMGAMESLVTKALLIPRALAAGVTRFSPALYGTAEEAAALLPESIGGGARETFRTLRKGAESFTDILRGDRSGVGHYGQVALGGVESIGSQVPGVIASILSGNPAFSYGFMGVQATGESFGRGLDKGISPYQNLPYGLSQGAIEWATEKAPALRLLKDVGAKSSLFKMIGNQLMAEIPGEQAATLLQDLNDWAVLSPEKTLSDYVAERPQAAADTLLATIVATVGMGSIAHYAGKMAEGEDAKIQRDAILEIGKLAEASKLRERSPEKFQEAVSRLVKGTEAENIYIPVEAWSDYWQKQGVEPSVMAQELGVAPDAYIEAVANNGPLQVATDAYARKIGPTEHNAFFADEVKLKPEGMNAREFKDYMAKPENFEEPTPEEVQVQDANQVETAIFDLVAEGKDLEAITDEDIAAKIESYGQAPIKPVAETGITEQGVAGQVGGEAVKRIVTDEMYQDAVKQWKDKTSGVLRSGIDPTMLAPLVTMGAYHIESGLKTFKKWSEQMVKDFGEKVKPYLKDIWKQSDDYLKARTPTAAVKGQVRRATGLQTTAKMIREDEALSAAWKKAEQSARIAFRAGNKEGIAEARTAMKESLQRAKLKEAEHEKIAKDIKTLKKLKDKSKGKIAVEYQEAIRHILEGIDFAKPTDDTILRLTALHDHIIQNGVPLGISQAELNKLGRLSQVSVRDLAPDALGRLAETVRKLYDLGKLKKELLDKKEGREQQQALDSLIASTKSLDPTQSGQEEPTRGDIVKAGAAALNIDIQHTFRVADSIDGVKDYAGENASMIKEQMQSEIAAKNESNRRSRSLVEGIQAVMHKAGIDEITEDMQARITINMMVNQGARSQAVVLMEKYGFAEVPALNATELQIAVLAVQSVGEKTTDIADLYQKRENLAFPEVNNYFPIKYVNEEVSIPVPTMIMQDRNRTRQTEQGFTVTRTPGVQKLPRIDFLAVAEEAINAQEWYVNVQPVLDTHAALIRTPEYKLTAGQLASNWWKDQIDIVARRGWSASAKSNPLYRMARMNINQAVLGYKLTTIFMQPFAVFDAVAYATSRWGLGAGKDILVGFGDSWINPKAAMAYIKGNPALNLRQAGEIAIEETMEDIKGKKGAYTTYKKYAMSGIRATDIMTAAGVQKGFLNILKKHGVTGAEAEAEAEFLMNLTNGSSEITVRPHVLARGEGARLWLTFQSFFLNRWGILTHDLMASGYSGNWSRKATALMGLLIMMAGGLAEDKTRELLGLLMGGKVDSESFWKKVILYVPRQLPAIGGLFEKWGKAEPPLIQTLGKGAKGISQIGAGKPIAGFESLAESILTVGFGVPGTIQGFDLLDAAVLNDIKKEESANNRRSQ